MNRKEIKVKLKTICITTVCIALIGCKQDEQLAQQNQTIDSLFNQAALLRETINELTDANKSLEDAVSQEQQMNRRANDSMNYYKGQYEIVYAQAEKRGDTPPYIDLYPLQDGQIDTEQSAESISISKLAGFEIDTSDTNSLYNGFRIDFDDDGAEDVVILKYFRESYFLSELFFYRKVGVEYQLVGHSRINDRVDSAELYKSVEVADIDNNNFPDFYIHTSTGGSGGGHSSYILQWYEDGIHHSNVITTGKYTGLYDVDENGTLEMEHVNYVDYSIHIYHNDQQGVQVFEYIDYHITDMTDGYGHVEEKLRAVLR